MKPYYEQDGITIYNGDCLDIMSSLAPVDIVVTDPPYNVGINYGADVDDNKTRQGFIDWMRPRFQEMRRLAKTVLITGQARLPDYAILEPWKWLLAWHKPAAMGRSPVGFCNWEPVAMWGAGSNEGVDIFSAPIVPMPEVEGHPCPKPFAWASKQLQLFPKYRAVLDPFMGSGTVIVASKRSGRKAIGIEINSEYCDMAIARLSQTELFGIGAQNTMEAGETAYNSASTQPEQLSLDGVL